MYQTKLYLQNTFKQRDFIQKNRIGWTIPFTYHAITLGAFEKMIGIVYYLDICEKLSPSGWVWKWRECRIAWYAIIIHTCIHDIISQKIYLIQALDLCSLASTSPKWDRLYNQNFVVIYLFSLKEWRLHQLSSFSNEIPFRFQISIYLATSLQYHRHCHSNST